METKWTPITDGLMCDPAIERRDVPARVWRSMAIIEASRNDLLDAGIITAQRAKRKANKLREHNTRIAKTLQAIVARINGVFDDPALLEYGELDISTERDCLRIAKHGLQIWKE